MDIEKVYGPSLAPGLVGKRVAWNDYVAGQPIRRTGVVVMTDPTNIYGCVVRLDRDDSLSVVAAVRLLEV